MIWLQHVIAPTQGQQHCQVCGKVITLGGFEHGITVYESENGVLQTTRPVLEEDDTILSCSRE